jgi:hypothetical protein
LLAPALTALIAFALSLWIVALHFAIQPDVFPWPSADGASLFVFSLVSWRQPAWNT